MRYAGARHAGATDAKIAAIDDETSDLLSPRERAALRFAEKLAVDHRKVDDALWSELRRHFCEESERQSGTSASIRTYAKNPAVLKALSTFRATLARESTIDPALRELVRLKIAALNACRY